jgi:hypothetical protein
MPVARQKREVEYFKEGAVGEHRIFFLELYVALMDEDPVPAEPYKILHFGKVLFKGRPCRSYRQACPDDLGWGLYISDNAVDTIRLGMKTIIAGFEADIFKNEETGRHAYGQSHDIDKRKNPVAEEVAEGDLEIILYHTPSVAKEVPLLQWIVNQEVVASMPQGNVRIRYISCPLTCFYQPPGRYKNCIDSAALILPE